MAALTATGGSGRYRSASIAGTGLSASTTYDLLVKSGSGKSWVQVTTDGAGAFTYTFCPEPGTFSGEVHLTAERAGTTTAQVSASGTQPGTMP